MINIKLGKNHNLMNMGKMIEWANVRVDEITEIEANEGLRIAVRIAPKSPRGGHSLIQAIAAEPTGRGKSTWSIISRTPKTQKDYKGRPSKRIVPYHKYLHEGKRGNYIGSLKTGDHQYMYTIARILAKKYPQLVRKSLDKQIKGLK